MTDRAVDLLARTIIGEAGNQDDVGKAAVAHVVKNRLASGRYGKTIDDVLFAPKQFEPWNTRKGELMGYGPQTKGFDEAQVLARMVLDGKLDDPTGGATHFANVDTVRQRRNNKALNWIDQMSQNGSAMKIGAHTFGSPDSQPGASGGGSAPSLRKGTHTGGRNAPTPMSPQRQAIRELMAQILQELDLSALPSGDPGVTAPSPGQPMSAMQGQGAGAAMAPPPAAPPMQPDPHAVNPAEGFFV